MTIEEFMAGVAPRLGGYGRLRTMVFFQDRTFPGNFFER